jgi:phosphoglycolate phosphatase
MRYRLIIFDFDGTLADSFPWFKSALNTVAGELGFRRVAEHDVPMLRRLGPRALMKHLGISLWKTPLIAWRLRRMMARDVDRIALFDGAGDLLRHLSRSGATLALVTSNSRKNVERLLGPELSSLISHYECDTSAFGKRARFRRVLRRSGVARSEVLCIGDELRDLEAARSLGLAFGAVSWGYSDAEALREASPTELFATLQQIEATLT